MLARVMTMVTVLVFGLTGCIVNVNSAGRDDFDYHKQTQLTLDAQSLETLVADTGAGSLKIVGDASVEQITLDADIYGFDGAEPELTLTRSGNKAKLVANFDAFHRASFSNGKSPYIDLLVKVPAGIKLDIHDGSGSIVIRGVQADMEIEDGSGAIEIDGGYKLTIDDGSGSITLTNVAGDIQVKDGSGSLTIASVQGGVEIDDGSGAIEVRGVQGKVTIDDGSGGIRVVDTQGLHIIDAGSGSLSFDNIQGQVSID
ncbi:DUF4097 domain-containing protein [Shewanella alkalitolerans]|uniref:DUF4097 domain-containing protein n=1 Tax=Shewanella alkalitolerans TaxID=2864209 RepID=UPI001C660FED|nr:DUF4097 domain-containing protein [Shewanella alkalitolerans]QYJ97720.1 DUF4097 domain-containing protein [Shewanella alkalitolerans]